MFRAFVFYRAQELRNPIPFQTLSFRSGLIIVVALRALAIRVGFRVCCNILIFWTTKGRRLLPTPIVLLFVIRVLDFGNC